MTSAVLPRSFQPSRKAASTSENPSFPSIRLPALNAETVSTRQAGRTRASSLTTPITTRSTPPISVGVRRVAMIMVNGRPGRAVAMSGTVLVASS